MAAPPGNVTDTAYAAIADQITHVLIWLPKWQAKVGPGGWELVTIAEYVAGDIQGTWDGPGLSKDAPVPDLAEWVRQRIGHPVALYRDTESLIVPFRLRMSLRNPIYYVTPAGR